MKGFFATLAAATRSKSPDGRKASPLSPPTSPNTKPATIAILPKSSDELPGMLSWNDKDVTTSSGSTTQLELFKRLHEQWKQAESQGVFIDSKAHISLSAFLAVMHGSAHLSIADRKALETALQQASIDIVADKQQNPHAGDNTAIYGVHTGLGGTADTRSRDAQAAQASLITHLNAGMSNHLHDARVTRGAMVLRVLAMTRGGSAVRLEVIEALVKLIEARVVPCVPLRGSIGDSGDLIPLSYVAGLISGRFNHDAKAATDFKGHFLTGHQALLLAGVPKPITFTAKEALALVNGTSFSCAMAASCVLDAHSLTLLVQILTAFSTEVLAGDVDAFDPAVARLRPHPRQVEVCTNITHLLRDSKLAAKDKSARVPLLWRHTMPRDRYSIRAASQWLCPLVECLGQITKTLEIEINSVTDNPLVDVETKSILHGGNFQALSVADAMDRLRLQLHNAGRLIFAQHSELMNPTTNQGLPANLAWGPAGTDFGFKGLDVSMASYLSELGDLALPMSVQSAELHNQSVNSLISARKTAHAIEILQMMCACLMAALCQAADLRAVESAICKRVFITISKQVRDLGIRNSNRLIPLLEDAIAVKLTEHRELELSDCITLAVESASGKLVASPECAHLTVLQLKGFSDSLFQGIQKDIDASLQEVGNGLGYSVLSSSSRNLYSHIRNRVKIPMYKDSTSFNMGKMLDQILLFVQTRQDLDKTILESFDGTDNHGTGPRSSNDSMTPDLDTDSVTAHYTRDVSLDYEIPPSPFKIQRMNNSTESAEIPIVSNVDVMPVASIPPSLASSKSAVTPCPPLDSKPEEIAIIGIGCRYPNDIYSPDEFWDRTLVDANSFITDIPTTTRKSFRRASPTIRGGFLSKEVVEEFDCGFFGLSPSEAKSMDPQHRLILETVHSALEDANIPLDSLKGTDTGVFIGCRPSGHDVRNFELFGMDDSPRYTAVGTDLTFSANRVSFWLDLKGPSHSVTSACSTGGVLLDIGVRSILQGQCKMAVVGAVSVMTHESVFGILKAAGIQSVAGKCASYDKDADGYVPTESSVVFIIKKLSDAVKCGDRIIATVSGISNRHKGREGLGISYPCGDANTNAINEALAAAKWTSDEVEFVEAHATGTKTGDPVEAAAIAKSFQSETRSSPVYIGAVKSIVGHTENVAALTSMVKVCLAMREDMIPPTLLDLSRLNPAVAKSFDIIPAEIPTKSTPWNSISFGKKSLVLAAGLGGSVIAVAMKAAPFNSATQSISSVCRVLTISAANPSSLLALRDSYVALISKSGEDVLNRIVVSSNLGRQHMRQRIAIPVENKASLIGSLQRSELHKLSPKKPTFIFVFPGQGSLDLEACAEMHRTVAAFRQCIQLCVFALNDLGFPTSILTDVVQGVNTNIRGEYEQTVLLLLQYSIAKTMIDIGISPSCLVGHSFGEIVAATISGALSLKTSILLTHERHKPMLQPECAGIMVSAFASAQILREAIKECKALVDIAAFNGKDQHVISGESSQIEKLIIKLSKSNIRIHRLPNVIAFHSHRVQDASQVFEEAMEGIYKSDKIQIPLASCLTSLVMSKGSFIPLKHWVSHIVQPVLFAGTISAVDSDYPNATYIDIGAGSISSLVRRHLTPTPGSRQYLGALNSFATVIATLYNQGVEIDWKELHGHEFPRSNMATLPLYKYTRVPVWDDVEQNMNQRVANLPMTVSNAMPRPKIAIVGMAVRLPGGVVSLEHLWRALKAESVMGGSLPSDRPEFLFQNPELRKLKAAFIDEAFMLDTSLFKIPEAEAYTVAPHLRVQLETAWNAIESANIIPSAVGSYRAGVFSNTSAGSHDLYSNRLVASGIIAKPAGSKGLFIPEENGFLAQKLGFKDALTIAINGYCEGSITMLQSVSDALQQNRIDVAIANSVRVFETEDHLKQDCFFNAVGGGLVGEGAISIVLKRYDDAVREQNPIYAVLGETAIANDFDRGNARAMTTLTAAKTSGINVKDMDLILWSPNVARTGCIRLFSDTMPKTDDPVQGSYSMALFGKIFHAGGLFGLVAGSLMMKYGEIPASDPSRFPAMFTPAQLRQMNMSCSGKLWPKKQSGLVRNATISIGGLHGSSGAVTLLEPPESSTVSAPSAGKIQLLVISAESWKSIAALCLEYAYAVLKTSDLPAFCQATRLCRVAFKHKIAVTGRSATEICAKLKKISLSDFNSCKPQDVLIIYQSSLYLKQLVQGWKLGGRGGITETNGSQILESILHGLGLKAAVSSIDDIKNLKIPNNTLVLAVGESGFTTSISELLPTSVLEISDQLSVEELFAELYPYSMTTVFSAYDDFLRVPKLSPEILPSYIFDRQNVQMPDISGMDLNRSATLSYTPTTFKNLSGSFKPNVQQVRNSENAWIVDHKLRSGAVILPGAALLSIALSALSPHTVASLSFIKPVVLEETADAEFLIARTSTQLDSFQVRQGGIVHCEGIFITETAQVVRTNILEQLPSLLSCGKEIDTKKWYESDQGSIAYGSRFRNVNYLRTYDNGDALACIELPSDITAGDWMIHPTLLDACFHMMAIITTDGSLPVCVEKVWVSESLRNGTHPKSVWCLRSEVDMQSELQTGNKLEIFDANTGDCLMVVGALIVQLIGESMRPESLVWVKEWAQIEMPEKLELSCIHLLIGDNDLVINMLEKELNNVHRIIIGDNIAELIDAIPWDNLMIAATNTLQIVYCGTLVPSITTSAANTWWEIGGYSLFMAVWRELTSRRVKGIDSITATYISPALKTTSGVVSSDPALAGLILNIHCELRNKANVLLLNPEALTASLEQCKSILHGPLDIASGSYYLEGSSLSKLSFTPFRKMSRHQQAKQQLSIMVTGGAGGLATSLALHFILNGHKVTLAGRRDSSDESVINFVKKVASERLTYIKLDVTKEQQVSNVLNAGDFDGIVHTAGVLDNSLLSNLTTASLRSIGKPKIEGALAILQNVPRHKHCTVVFTSSVAAAIGSFGQTGYVMANTVMDSIATQYCDKISYLSVRSVQLGLVDGVGMANVADASHTQGDVTISKDETIKIISSILQSPRAFAPVVIAAPLGKFLKSQEVAVQPEIVEKVDKDGALLFITEQMSILMGFNTIDSFATFSQLGVDSVSSITLQKNIEIKFGVNVPLLNLFQMTPDALAEDISERMRAPSSVAQQKQSTPVEHILAVEAEGREGELTILNSFQELIHKSRINTVPEMLKHHTVVRPKSPFIQPSKNSKDDISFEKFEALSDAAMNIIADSFGNIVAGSSPPVVSIMAGTSYEAMIITMAVWKLGWTTAMLNPKASVDLLIRQAQAVSSAALISVDKRDLSNAATVSETLAIPLLMTDSNVLLTPPRISESETAKILAVKLPLKPDTPLCFLFSSSSVDGTSIKAARLSHGQVLENCKMRDMLWNSPYTTTTSKVLTWLPFSHVMGLIVDFVNNGLVAGMTLCLRPSREHPATPEFLLDDVIAVKPSLMYTVPWVLDSWVSKFDTNQNSGNHVDMSTAVSVLRGMNALIAGGAPLKPETRKFLVSRGIHILEGMGATEAAGTIFTGLLKPASSSAQDEEGWMTPLPGFTIVLEPTEGWPNENMGMLAISAPSISKHVVSARSGETCLDLIPRNLLVDGGLFRTGDIFEKRIVVLGEGSELTEYRFVSRADDAVMLSTGFAVAPSMLEESLVAEFSDVSCACLLADFRSIPHLILKMNENGALRSNIDTLKMISACIRRCAPELQIDGSRLIVVGPDFVMPMSPKNTILRGRLRSTLFNNR